MYVYVRDLRSMRCCVIWSTPRCRHNYNRGRGLYGCRMQHACTCMMVMVLLRLELMYMLRVRTRARE